MIHQDQPFQQPGGAWDCRRRPGSARGPSSAPARGRPPCPAGSPPRRRGRRSWPRDRPSPPSRPAPPTRPPPDRAPAAPGDRPRPARTGARAPRKDRRVARHQGAQHSGHELDDGPELRRRRRRAFRGRRLPDPGRQRLLRLRDPPSAWPAWCSPPSRARTAPRAVSAAVPGTPAGSPRRPPARVRSSSRRRSRAASRPRARPGSDPFAARDRSPGRSGWAGKAGSRAGPRRGGGGRRATSVRRAPPPRPGRSGPRPRSDRGRGRSRLRRRRAAAGSEPGQRVRRGGRRGPDPTGSAPPPSDRPGPARTSGIRAPLASA